MIVDAFAKEPSGEALANLGWTEVDLTDGSWTLTDPDSLVKSNTFSGGFNNVVMNALAVGSSGYDWGSGNNQRAPRWHKKLSIDGTQVKSGDTFILMCRIRKGTTTSEWNTEVVCATSVDATAVSAFDTDSQGGMLEYISGSNQGYGAYTFNSKTTLTNLNNTYGVMTVLHSGSRGQGVVFCTMQSDDTAFSGGSRNAGMAYDSVTIDMDLFIGVGTRGGDTIDDGQDTDFKVEFKVIKFSP